jgi:transcriptional regulator with XRE-family HTH domain
MNNSFDVSSQAKPAEKAQLRSISVRKLVVAQNFVHNISEMERSDLDSKEFKQRVTDCISSAGSVYALAKRAGTTPNTIRRYLANSEPTRPMLVAIAKASGVTVEWLATGQPPSNPSDADVRMTSTPSSKKAQQ